MSTASKYPHTALIVGDKSTAVVAREACIIELKKSACPFPIVTVVQRAPYLPNWADGYTPAVPATQRGRLMLPPQKNIYIIQHGVAQPVPLLQQAHLLSGLHPSPDLLVGPFRAPLVSDLIRKSRVNGGVVELLPE